MSKSEEIKVNIESKSTHRGPEKSTTLNRRYVKRPTKIIIDDGNETLKSTAKPKKAESPKIEYHKSKKIEINPDEAALFEITRASAKISHINIEHFEPTEERPILPVESIEPVKSIIPKIAPEESPDLPPAPNPYQEALDAKKAEREKAKINEISSKALKEAAIERALSEMQAEEKAPETVSKKAKKEEKIAERVMLNELRAEKAAKKLEKKNARHARKVESKRLKKRRGGRVLLAFAASAACMIALAMVVRVNLPNISVQVAAAQTGVEASYPSYTPRDFSLTGVYTDDSSVIIEFTGPNSTNFTLSEEKSSWDANALVTNYVRGAYGSDYETVREQGTTIYIYRSNATWIKNGTLYKLTAPAGTLTKRQIKNIVTSL